MKLILKLAALILALGSVACLILANMERISDWMACLWAKVQAKKELICRTCPCEGDIEDEYDQEENDVQELDANTYAVEGTAELEDLEELLHISFEKDEDYDTLGGFMTHMLGRIPKAGENPGFDYGGYRFTVMEVEERRVAKVKIQRLPPAEPEGTADSKEK